VAAPICKAQFAFGSSERLLTAANGNVRRGALCYTLSRSRTVRYYLATLTRASGRSKAEKIAAALRSVSHRLRRQRQMVKPCNSTLGVRRAVGHKHANDHGWQIKS
jgi:hypothetical protein